MKTTKKILAAALLIVGMGTATVAEGQSNFAIGLRLGETSGLTLKKYNQSSALEGIIGANEGGVSFTGLYEILKPATNNFTWYYGGGGHISAGRRYYYYKFGRDGYYDGYYSSGSAFGVDGIVGFEYKIPPIPFAISLDFKPYLEIRSGGGVYVSPDLGLGFKFKF